MTLWKSLGQANLFPFRSDESCVLYLFQGVKQENHGLSQALARLAHLGLDSPALLV